MLESELMVDSMNGKTEGFHLFIEPVEPLAGELSSIIQRLAKECGGPIFRPHVTLLAGIPAGPEGIIISKARAVADALTPFSLTLGRLDIGDVYFRALYFKIKETKKMNMYHTLAKQVFEMEDDNIYVPHVSLLYGNYLRAKMEKIIETLAISSESFFFVNRIHLYRTNGDVADWRKLEEFELIAS